ncbi:MAG TPA: alpha/beta fold hydrolase, partial [Phycisphaerales bacterium]|nr:alpha/beta fold hydrolase [Phycisphaerales bacterium]
RRGALDPVRTAAKLRAPLLVLHGDRDQIAPAADARAIAEAAPHGRLRAIAGAGHTDVWSNPASAPLAVAAVREFLAGAWR